MLKRLLFIAAMFAAISSFGQDSLSKCRMNRDYLLSMIISPETSTLVVPSPYASGAIETCGKYVIYYNDVAISSGEGFDDPTYGATRRSTLCSVLTYMQSVLDYSAVPAGGIRLLVDTSYSPSRPSDTFFVGMSSPGFDVTGLSGGSVVNGFVHDYILSGTDPAPGHFHATMKMNFDRFVIPWRLGLGFPFSDTIAVNYNNGLDTPASCETDLFTSFLHLQTHTLGWFSWLGNTHGIVHDTTWYSSIDTAMTYGNVVSGALNNWRHSLYVLGIASPQWINGKKSPYNYPVGIGGHLAETFTGSRLSPGDYQGYNMIDYVHPGLMLREWKKGERETLHDVLGYGYNPAYASSHATLIANRIPYSTKMSSAAYNNVERYNYYYFDNIKPDYTLTNNTGASLTIVLSADTSLHDADGDSISVMPGSLVNFRGCGQGGNNHNLLTVSGGGKVITYTPRANFYGPATFGFNLWDGKEKGAFMVYNINVVKGTAVVVPPDGNLVLNGDFEEGSEVKIKDSAEYVNNTAHLVQSSDYFPGRLRYGTHFTDCHPYPDGAVIRNSYVECDETTKWRSDFGNYGFSFPWRWGKSWPFGGASIYTKYPDSSLDNSNRYEKVHGPQLFNLADSMRKCHHYQVEFDAIRSNFGGWSYPIPDTVYINGTQTRYVTNPDSVHIISYISKAYTSDVNVAAWTHIKMSFTYCNDTPSNVLYWRMLGCRKGPYVADLLIDNMKLKEIPLTVVASDTLIKPCVHHLTAKINVEHGCIPVTYTWQKLGGPVISTSTFSDIDVSPASTTSYVVTVSVGCSDAKDTITVSGSVCPCSIGTIFGDTVGFTTLTGTVSAPTGSRYYYVPLDITITGTPVFSNANMLMAPGVTVTVASDAKLILDSCHLFTCPDSNKLWKGIVLASDPTSSGRIIVRHNSMIEDAEVAIKAVDAKAPFTDSLIIFTDEAVFNRNIIGVQIDNYTTVSGTATYPFRFQRSVFTARKFDKISFSGYPRIWPRQSVLKTYTSRLGDPPYVIDRDYMRVTCKNGTFAQAGIKLNNVGLTSGTAPYFGYKEIVVGGKGDTSQSNLFDNMGNGINAYNTNLTAYNNIFIRIGKVMVPGGPVLSSYEGSGICAEAGLGTKYRIRVTWEDGVNSPPLSYFYNCYRGVSISNYFSAISEHTLMTSTHTWGTVTPGGITATNDGYGIYIRSKNNAYIRVGANDISNVHNGIWINIENAKGLSPVPYCLVYNNRISGRNPLFGWGVTGGQYVYQAIKVQSALSTADDSIRVAKNNLDSVYNGIDLTYFRSRYCSADSNVAWMVRCPDGKRQAAISVTGTTGAQVIGNFVKSVAAGVSSNDSIRAYYLYGNTSLRVKGNSAEATGRGFEFVGNQNGTQWLCNTMMNHRKGYLVNGYIGTQGGYSLGITSVCGNQWLGSGWNPLSGPYQTFTYGSSLPKNSTLYVNSGAATNPTANDAQPGLPAYRYSSSNGLIVASGAIYSECISIGNPLSPTRPKFSFSLAPAIAMDTMQYDHDADINRWMDQYRLWRTLINDTAFNDSSSQALNFLAAADSTRYKWLTDIEEALSDGDAATATNLLQNPVSATGLHQSTADVLITDLTDANYIVQNYLDFYSLYRDYINGDPVDSIDLVSIANLCPLMHGDVVFAARSLRALLYGYTEPYDDEDICSINSGERLAKPYVPGPQYQLYPNPNDGNMTIARSTAARISAEVEIYNLWGARVYQCSYDFAAGIVHLQLKHLSPGLYILRLKDDTGKTFSNKFTIK